LYAPSRAGRSTSTRSHRPPRRRSWFALDATGLGGSLQLGTLASATLTDVVVRLNRATGTTHLLNWSTDVTARPSRSLHLGLADEVSGNVVSLVIGSFIHGSGHFDLTKQPGGVTLGGGDLVKPRCC